MDISNQRGTPERERTFPRSAFLSYQSLIARESMAPREGADLEERLTCEQWETER